ncbi:MAG: trypsin-like peptidase domain-containing protein [Ignavibacteriales bacterium]|nr:trypsin-like peptidase domain-containing protein [Ignavibacteriales bacterium]
MKIRKNCIFLFIFSLLFVSCTKNVYESMYPTLTDGKYDSEFPYYDVSAELENVIQSVKLLNVIAFYKSYEFDRNSKIKEENVNSETIKFKTIGTSNFEQTASGTATLIYNSFGYVAFITCAHIIDFPDTIITYFIDENRNLTDIIQSISIKENQINYVSDLPHGGDVEIITQDSQLDLAIVGNKFKEDEVKFLKVFEYPGGRAKELQWGSFVYVIGFPMNYKLVTKGIVSSPNIDSKGSFVIDAAFNRGFSGGIVLAIRDGIPNFELVGLVKSVPAFYEYYLKPVPGDERINFNPLIPYEGNIYIDKRINITFGITKVISIEVVRDYIKDNFDILKKKGYYLEDVFMEKAKLNE